VDNQIYRNDTNHHGFIYQNPNYNNQISHHRNEVEHASENLRLATIYVKPQVYNGVNSPSDALKQGTAFSELYRPFEKKSGGMKR